MGCLCDKTDHNSEVTFNHVATKKEVGLTVKLLAKNPTKQEVNTLENSLIPKERQEKLISARTKPKEKGDNTSKNEMSISEVAKRSPIELHSTNIVDQKECSPTEFFTLEKKLGEGSYGEVFRVKHKLLKISRAMKKITRRSRSAENEKEVLNEIKLLKTIDHPHIVKIFEFYVTKQAYFIITELCSGGELFDRISSNGPMDEKQAAYVMYQVFSAIFNCHSKNILHRDLKPENILIDRIEDGYLTVKIIDFGTAKIFEKDKAEQKVIGSAYYIAPEVLDKHYNEKCDLWSCGVILYILLTAKPPFGGNDEDIIRKIKVGVYDETPLQNKSPEVVDLIRGLLQLNPNKRLSAEEAISHAFFLKMGTKQKMFSMSEDKFNKAIVNLKDFKYQSKFQETAFTFLVHNSLHMEEVRDLYRVFCLIDIDMDGKITKKELFDAFKDLYKNKDDVLIKNEVDLIFKNIDSDNNGSLEYEEFVRAAIGKEKLLNETTLKFGFLFFDKDNSGEITLEEMQIIFGNQNDEALVRMIEEVDKDGNKLINFEEFKYMMNSLLK